VNDTGYPQMDAQNVAQVCHITVVTAGNA
jgi:hypothetical protein